MRSFALFISTVALFASTFGACALAQVLTPERERELKPKDSFRECDVCPEMVVVPAGSFTMGSPSNEPYRERSEGPQHVVRFSRPFAIGKSHVTVGQYGAFVTEIGYKGGSECWTIENTREATRKGRSWRNPGYPQTESHAASCLSWDDAKAYVAWLSKKARQAYRLPTEAEWEYAARARTQPGPAPRYIFGNDDKAICQYGNAADQTARKAPSLSREDQYFVPCSDGHPYAAPVGSFLPNDFGLYDMVGNVWQWTEDCLHGSYRGAPTDGSAWMSGDCSAHMLRGGAWDDYQMYLRAAMRYWGYRDDRGIMGFRVARSLP
jgi:formylglycine-generating enzyme required for sulfatase activity